MLHCVCVCVGGSELGSLQGVHMLYVHARQQESPWSWMGVLDVVEHINIQVHEIRLNYLK